MTDERGCKAERWCLDIDAVSDQGLRQLARSEVFLEAQFGTSVNRMTDSRQLARDPVDVCHRLELGFVGARDGHSNVA